LVAAQDASDETPTSSPPEVGPVDSTPSHPQDEGTVAPPPPSSYDLVISDFNFDPPDVTVVAGTTLRWHNAGPSTHTVTNINGMFDSGIVAVGADYSILIAAAGEYRYVSATHPDMQGTIRVTFPDGSPGPTPLT